MGQGPNLSTEISEQACNSSRTTTNIRSGLSRQPEGQPEMTGDGEPDAVTVCQLKSVSQFSMEIQVGDQTVEAIVDTAAQVTIISDRLYNRLKRKPQKIREVKLLTAGRQMSMKGFVVGPVRLKIGEKWYSEEVYVAPIEQEMLLGFDILFNRGAAILDMGQGTLTFDGQMIQLNMGSQKGVPIVARVVVGRRQVVPPNSVVRVICKSSDPMPDYFIEPVDGLKVLVPRVVRAAGTIPVMCVVNATDSYRLLKKGKQIGRAYPVKEYPELDHSSQVLMRVQSVQEGINSIPDQIPSHLQETFENSKEHLTEGQSLSLAKLLMEFQDVFAKDEFDLGNFTELEHGIDTGDARPVKQRMRRAPACFAGEEEAHLKKMLEAGVIQESVSEWASAPVLIRKRDGSVRWCIDYRALNNVTVKDVFPLPLVDDCLDTLAGSVWFSKLDANSAYWQVRIKAEDRKKTAFITKYGLFEHVKMGFGLCNAPATFARVMNLVLRGLNWQTVLAFLDDILVLGSSFEDHLTNLADALSRLRKYRLKLKPKKCIFFQREVEFLGRMVSSNTLSMSKENVQVIHDWPTPSCSKDVERWLGLANYHRVFVKDFSKLAEPLYSVIGKNKFRWEEDQQRAFIALKQALTSPPVLALPNHKDEYILDVDASDLGIGAELLQLQDGNEKVIAYGSFALSKEQRRYCATRKELLAIVRFTRLYRHYLLGRPFTVRTDHSSLTWLLRFKEPQGQLARWMEELSQYNMILKHRAGRRHVNADALSRVPVPRQCGEYVSGVGLSELPCGGCDYCARADRNWASFTRDVDEATLLASQGLRKIKLDPEGVIRDHRTRADDLEGSCRSIGTSALPRSQGSHVFTGSNDPSVMSVSSGDPVMTQKSMVLEASGGANMSKDIFSARIENIHIDAIMVERVQVLSCGTTSTVGTSCQNSCWGFSITDVVEAQAEDNDLSIILNWLSNKIEPKESELFLASPAAKSHWLNKEQYLLIDKVLYRNRGDTEEKDLVIPSKLKELVLRWNHDIPSGGHQGVARTKARIKEKFFWYGMGQDIANHVTTCDVCNRNKKADRYGHCGMKEYQASAPMERVHLDFMGPLPKTPRGNEYILMMVDQFTKWVECIPLPCQTAEVTAKAAVDHFFSRFGCPLQVFTDQGRNFESKLFTALCEELQIHKARTTPYRPSANGQVERYNRTLMDAVRCFIGKQQNQWDMHLQQLAGAIRASVNRNTGFTANKLMLGREVNVPAHVMFPHMKDNSANADDFVAKLTGQMQQAHDTARTTLKTSLNRMKRNYDLRILERQYEEGDVVYLLDSATLKGKCKKLCSPWKGPAVIIKKLSVSLFRVKLRNAIFVVNHDRLKPCHDRTLPAWVKQWQDNPVVEDPSKGEDKTPYCFCRKPWQGRFMIQCDYCDEWYHGSCVNITATDALDINKYKCETCKAR